MFAAVVIHRDVMDMPLLDIQAIGSFKSELVFAFCVVKLHLCRVLRDCQRSTLCKAKFLRNVAQHRLYA